MENIRVMLVEDHALVREGTRRLLALEKDLSVVAVAEDGETAVRLADVHRPDVILMDINIPKKNGLEATREIKAAHPRTAVLVLTAFDDDEYVSAFLQAGAAGYLLKDIDIKDLIRAVRDVYAGESVLHPAIAHKVVWDLARRTPAQDGNGTAVLSSIELDVLRLASRWMTNQEIGHELTLSAHAVQGHLTQILRTLGVGSRTEAVLFALRKGWLP
jgi:NarL family two-component system response regulator LiaR